MERVLIDCDTGVDDALALLIALSNPGIQVDSITTVSGNVSVEKTTENTLKILTLLNMSKVPVVEGSSIPLLKKSVDSTYVFQEDGLGGMASELETSLRSTNVDVVKHILEAIKLRGVKKILAFGPLTNIALAYQQNSEIMNSLEEIIIMGGAIGVAGNITKYAEFNFFSDPDAASYVLRKGTNIVLIPLDVTMKNLLAREKLDEVVNARLRSFIKKMTSRWFQFYEDLGIDGIPLHDPLVVGYLLNKNFLVLRKGKIEIDIDGERIGMSSCTQGDMILGKDIKYASENGEIEFVHHFIDLLNRILF